jgi:hypothetical protein
LKNKEGQTLTGKGYGVEEHLWSDQAATTHAEVGHNSEGTFVPTQHGESVDAVGFVRPVPDGSSAFVYQTFSVNYSGTVYNLHTEFEHTSVVGAGQNYQNDVLPIHP